MDKEKALKYQNGTIINGSMAQQTSSSSNSIENAKNCIEREQHPNEEFDIDAVIRSLAKALEDPNSTSLPHYIDAFAELKKLFSKLGVVFSFVETDLRNKHTILAQLHGQDPQTYATIEQMIYAECFDGKVPPQNGCISTEPKQPKAAGSRTLLRLHRSLAFLVRFVELVQKPPSPTESTSNLFRMAYAETLSKHHTWYIRASVQCASAMVPNRAQLIKIMFGINEIDKSNEMADFDEKQQKIDQIAERFLEMTRMAYERVEKFYGQHGLLDLP